MKEIPLKNWEEFEIELANLRQWHKETCKANKPVTASTLLFRGHHNCDFDLTTTLERESSTKETSFVGYYKLVSRAKPQIETFTGKTWRLPEHKDFIDKSKNFDGLFPMIDKWGIDGYSYMIYLRHHGFPSPLLDWSKSPYIAAYFAFRLSTPPQSGNIAIFAFCEYSGNGKTWAGNEAHISGQGPYVRSHKRHFLQQGEYTVCIQFKDNKEWYFVPHSEVFARNNPNQDTCWKFTLPWTERAKVLKILDNYNLNAFSLFDSEESLMETMSLRELTFRS